MRVGDGGLRVGDGTNGQETQALRFDERWARVWPAKAGT